VFPVFASVIGLMILASAVPLVPLVEFLNRQQGQSNQWQSNQNGEAR
jgi:hypothetical protein